MVWSQDKMCQIVADLEIKNGLYVNLGIGIPTLVANFIPKDKSIILHSENGMLGMGPFPLEKDVDPDLINAGKQTISELPISSYFDGATSFGMIRGGHIDLTILGALQVSEEGDLANWTIPGKMVKGMGGAMDLVAGAKRVVVIMEHVAKDGSCKLVKSCQFPLTGKKVVDLVVTDIAIFDMHKKDVNKPMELVGYCKDVSIEEIKSKTEAIFTVSSLVKTY
jgi:3-oxoacid CoA-transferase subunit B